MSLGMCLGGITDEGTMISNLPLLFADGYPTCLDRITLSQLEKFIPFMVQCSCGNDTSHKLTVPKWWPKDLEFSIPLVKPRILDSQWLAILKGLVSRCYTFHHCEFMLRFCNDLSQWPAKDLSFVNSWDGTTSLYNKVTGKLLVTFRDENMSYDRKRESPRKTLLPRNEVDPGRTQMVHPPLLDIYLCDSCDAEFSTLKEIQKHEKACCRQTIDSCQASALQHEDLSTDPTEQEIFLSCVELASSSCPKFPRREQDVEPPRYKRAFANGLRYFAIPFSSPLGVFIHKKSRILSGTASSSSGTKTNASTIDQYCSNKRSDVKNSNKELKHDSWPISFRPRRRLHDYVMDWVHIYKFPKRQLRRRAPFMQPNELSERSRNLLASCGMAQVKLQRLTQSEIEWYSAPKSKNTFNATASAPAVDSCMTALRHGSSVTSCSSVSCQQSAVSSVPGGRRTNNYTSNNCYRRETGETQVLPSMEVADSTYTEKPGDAAYNDSFINREMVDQNEVANGATKLCSCFSLDTQLLPNTLYVYDKPCMKKNNNEVRDIPVIDLCSSDEENEVSRRDICEPFRELRQSGVLSKGATCGCLEKTKLKICENQVVPSQGNDYRNGLPRLVNLYTPNGVDYYVDGESDNFVCVNNMKQRESESRSMKNKDLMETRHTQFQTRSPTEKSVLVTCGFNLTTHQAFPQEYSPVEAEVACTVPVQEGSSNWTPDQVDYHSDIEKLPKLHKHRRGL